MIFDSNATSEAALDEFWSSHHTQQRHMIFAKTIDHIS